MNEQIDEARERNYRGELLLRFLNTAKNIEGLERQTVEQIFDPKTENRRRELIAKLSAEQYKQLITGVNGILRGRNKKDWDMDGVGVTAAGEGVIGKHLFPRHEDKEEIIDETWQAAQRMNADGRPLQDIAMLLGSMLVETHPFGDGNGRTSRFIYRMIKDGYSGRADKNIAEVLGLYGRDEGDMALWKIELDALFEQKHGGSNKALNVLEINDVFDECPYGDLEFPKGTSEESRDTIIEAARNDHRILLSAIFHFLKNHREIDISDCLQTFQEGKRKTVSIKNLLEKLSAKQTDELAEMYWNIKKIYTKEMIDAFVNPNNPEYKTRVGAREMTLLEHFKLRLAQKSTLS